MNSVEINTRVRRYKFTSTLGLLVLTISLLFFFFDEKRKENFFFF